MVSLSDTKSKLVNEGMLTDLSFGEWLKRQRMGRGLTREQLADQVGCATVTLRKIESEDRRPSEQIAKRIADIFNIPTNERLAFLLFTRGDYTQAPSEQRAETPWQSPKTRNNLRTPLSSLIGRKAEIAAVRDYLNTPETRLVTLLGPPGIGKTRLSIATARESLPDFQDGVFFVELAPFEDSNLVALTVAQTLGFTEASDKTPIQRVTDGIGDKHMLIVLDNVEHVIDMIAVLASDLLLACPRLKILTTSREPIRSPGEWLYPVPVLTFPPEDEIPSLALEEFSQFTALKLFSERARAVKPDFALTKDNVQTIAQICTRLDGLPLAIELIAARVRLMSVGYLLTQMGDQFILSADGMRAVPARQKTLQNAIGWSYRLLPDNEKTLFRRLAVFAGGWILNTAQTVCADDLLPADEIRRALAQLVDKSLVVQQETVSGMRYHMLVTIRQYAQDKLAESKEAESTFNHHLDFFLQLAEKIEPTLHGPMQAESLERMEIEMDNFRTALRWGLTHNKESGVLLTGTLWLFWFMHSHFVEAKQWYEEALAVSEGISTFARMRLSVCIASISMGRGDNEQCATFSEQSLALARALENTWGIAMSLHHWGPVLMQRGDFEKAQLLLEEGLAVARESGHWTVLLYLLDDIGGLVLAQKNFKQAEHYFTEMRNLSQQHEELWVYSHALACLSSLALSQMEYEKVKTLCHESLTLANETGNIRLIALNLKYFGLVAYGVGRFTQAVLLLSAAESLAESIESRIGSTKEELNDLRTQMGDAVFESLQAEGQTMSMEQAIALAIDDHK